MYNSFWKSVSDLLRVCDCKMNITVKTITFGISHSKPKCDAIVINFIISLAKILFFKTDKIKKKFQTYMFASIIKIEKEIV